MKIDLQGKNILVTGASRGIGRAIAEHLAKAGARIAVHFTQRRAEAEEVAGGCGNESIIFQADLEDAAQCEGLFNDMVGRFGQLHALVNNAGIAIESTGDCNSWVHDWDKTMAVNLRATGLLCRLAVEHFQRFDGGRIVNIASRAAHRGDTSDYLAYAASKGGVVALSKSLARAYGKDNVGCFVISPGFVRTEMSQAFMDKYGDSIALDDIALPKLTEPNDLGPLITLLCSGLADHATGTTIDVNAGSYAH